MNKNLSPRHFLNDLLSLASVCNLVCHDLDIIQLTKEGVGLMTANVHH